MYPGMFSLMILPRRPPLSDKDKEGDQQDEGCPTKELRCTAGYRSQQLTGLTEQWLDTEINWSVTR